MSRETALDQVAAVEATVARSVVEKAIHDFLGSYPAKTMDDVNRRAALFDDAAVLEDPVGAKPTRGKAELMEFFKGPMLSGMIIHMNAEKIIVSGNEAISFTRASWGMEGVEPARVQIVHNFVVNSDGKITRVRIFFDEGCVQ
jgi:hypothetical protein